MKNVQEKNDLAREDTPKVIRDDNRTASEDTVLSPSVSPDQVNNEVAAIPLAEFAAFADRLWYRFQAERFAWPFAWPTAERAVWDRAVANELTDMAPRLR